MCLAAFLLLFSTACSMLRSTPRTSSCGAQPTPCLVCSQWWDEEGMPFFKEKVKIMASLSHPNVERFEVGGRAACTSPCMLFTFDLAGARGPSARHTARGGVGDGAAASVAGSV